MTTATACFKVKSAFEPLFIDYCQLLAKQKFDCRNDDWLVRLYTVRLLLLSLISYQKQNLRLKLLKDIVV